jgi:prepilin-type N-terminal cleavage/methylation domain-containing protein
MRGFSLLEAMTVVAVVGLAASVAAPNLATLAQTYRGREGARGALLALADGRDTSQKNNQAVRVDVYADHIDVMVPDSVESVGLLTRVRSWAPSRSRRVDVDVVAVDGGGSSTTPSRDTPALLYFCPSSDATWLHGDTSAPVCTLGNLASRSATVQLRQGSASFVIELSAALASLRLR